MARGTPDGGLSSYEYASQAIDPAAIYQYQWGFSPLDGAGRLLYLDTFNNGMAGWGSAKTGSAILPELFADAGGLVFSPPYAVKLDPGTVANDLSWIYRTYFLGVNPRLAIEAGFLFSIFTSWFFRLDYNLGGTGGAYVPIIFYNAATGFWQVQVNGGSYENIYQMNNAASNVYLMQIKIVGDWSTGKYVRALIGDNLIDLSAFDMPVSASTIDGYISYTARTISIGATNVAGYLGMVLLTKDEP